MSKLDDRQERDLVAPLPGHTAPDFELEIVKGEGGRTGQMRKLSDSRGKPVALIFGSYTWPPFRREAGRLNQIYEQYKDRVSFFCVYIQEAHPEDGWQLPDNHTDNVVYDQPKTIEERASVAEACVLHLDLAMPTVLDDMDNSTDTAYAALPERLYVIDREGRVIHRSEPGPFGFDVSAWEQSVAQTAS
jgi:hypothetical protein